MYTAYIVRRMRITLSIETSLSRVRDSEFRRSTANNTLNITEYTYSGVDI